MAWLQKLSQRISSSSKPEDAITQFSKHWQAITAILDPTEPTPTGPSLQQRLDAVLALLIAESASANTRNTGPCFELLLKADLLSSLVTLALPDEPLGSLQVVIKWCAALIANSEETLLCHATVHKALLKLVKGCVQPEGDIITNQDYELELVDLLAIIAGRIRSCPDLLPIFFRPHTSAPSTTERVTSPTPSMASTTASSRRSIHAECLLFTFLLRFVHREGQTGDLARVGLLKLIQVAFQSHPHRPMPSSSTDLSRSDQTIIDLSSRQPVSAEQQHHKSLESSLLLAEWLLDSDFAEVLGAGLGALFGLLPSKVAGELYQFQDAAQSYDFVDGEDAPTPTGTVRRMRSLGLGQLDSEDVTAQRVTFLSLLEFTEDVLHCSSDIAIHDREKALVAASLQDAVLSALKTIFLDAVLYPCIMECSQVDGSALAVLTYLTDMVDTARSGDALASELLSYLLGSESTSKEKKLAKRKSTTLLLLQTGLQEDLRYQSSDRFTLKDILLQNLQSTPSDRSKQSQVTQTATLKLLQLILDKHAAFALRLLEAKPRPRCTGYPALVGEEEEEEFIYDAEAQPSPAARLDVQVVQLQSLRSLLSTSDDNESKSALMSAALHLSSSPSFIHPASSTHHILSSSTPLVHTLLQHLSLFFSHAPAFNLALTELLVQLASCPLRSLEGWFIGPSGVLAIYTSLAGRLEEVRQEVDDFDELWRQRTESFEMVQHLAEALDDSTFHLPSATASASAAHAAAHPFAEHYAKTSSIRLMPPVAASSSDADISIRMISLSLLLDNLAIFEASLLELVAILQVRRSAGIDTVATI